MEMSKDQIKNFRRGLIGVLGPYALLMSEDDVIRMRDKMQSHLDEEEEK